MPFHEIRIDPNISYGSLAGVEYATSVLELPSGEEQRQSYTTAGRKRFRIKKENFDRERLAYLEGFFRARKGRFYGFRFADIPNNDYKVVDEQIYSLIDNTHLQLVKTYPDSVNAETVKILKPVLSADVSAVFPDITLTRSTTVIGGPYTAYSNSNWTIDRTTGIITFTAGSQAGNFFRWSGAYDTPVRFEIDFAEFNREWMDVFHAELSMMELKYP